MKKSRKITLSLVSIVVLGGAVWTSVPPAAVYAMQNHSTHPMDKSQEEDTNKLKSASSHHLPALSVLLEKAVAAVKAGDDKAALTHLQTAQSVLERVKRVVEEAVQPPFTNTKCPMMGGAINPQKITPALTREFDGQKVAFCCAGCPDMWDKLSNADKQAKLNSQRPNSASGPHVHH